MTWVTGASAELVKQNGQKDRTSTAVPKQQNMLQDVSVFRCFFMFLLFSFVPNHQTFGVLEMLLTAKLAHHS